MKRSSQINKKRISQAPAVANTTRGPRGGRPVRSAKQVQPAPGYLDSGTLLFDSEDEGTGSESDHYSEDQGGTEAADKDRHVTKKLRLHGKFKAQAEAPSPKPDSSCLAYYPETYAASRKWNKLLGLPPPNPMGDGPTINVPERDVDAHGRSPSTKPELNPLPVLPGFRVATKSEFYPTKKTSGFEDLPGEIRNQIYALVFKKRAPIDFMNRSGFARSAAFLRVNRLVYNEARVFVYSENRFCFGYNFAKSGKYFESEWKELGWTHIRRFLTDIGPANTSLIKNLGILFLDATQSSIPYMPLDLRRFTHNEDVLWILSHLSRHGKVTKLKLGFCGRRAIRMSTRDGDFLNALKGVKTDKLEFGDPRPDVHSLHTARYYTKVDALAKELLKAVMVRPLPLKDLDPRLQF